MKTNTFRFTLLAGAVLALGTGVAIPAAIAGPEFWPSVSNREKAGAATPDSAERGSVSCIDARWVNVTETKPRWHNGRGPLLTTELGKKLECTSCDTPMVAMKPSGHNGRGAMAPVAIKGKHDCAKSNCAPAVAAAH